MIGGLAALAAQNSCQKDIFDLPTGSGKDRMLGNPPSQDLRSIFFEAVDTEKPGKTCYLVESVRKNVRKNQVFLEELFRSEYCDEMHVYGIIREVKHGSVPMMTGKSRSKIIAHDDKTYEIAVYSRTRIIKLPCNQQTVRRIRTQYDMMGTRSGFKTATFGKNGGR